MEIVKSEGKLYNQNTIFHDPMFRAGNMVIQHISSNISWKVSTLSTISWFSSVTPEGWELSFFSQSGVEGKGYLINIGREEYKVKDNLKSRTGGL